jgi:hypothetical protein
MNTKEIPVGTNTYTLEIESQCPINSSLNAKSHVNKELHEVGFFRDINISTHVK